MGKELTPMQEAIENIWKLEKLTDYQKTLVEKELTELLPKQKQVIEDACNDTRKYLTGQDHVNIGEIYYNTKFRKDE